MTATTTPATRTALYFKPGGKGRWRRWRIYDTRERAFRAVDELPGRHAVFLLANVPSPRPEADPTKFPAGAR